mmetsp:Transcript_27283/g.43855  ORF Transcript_27283/g.43855 Transcript_27283/m.43855 type:complete len:90 (-) Transcript_27283:8-277(-)
MYSPLECEEWYRHQGTKQAKLRPVTQTPSQFPVPATAANQAVRRVPDPTQAPESEKTCTGGFPGVRVQMGGGGAFAEKASICFGALQCQ